MRPAGTPAAFSCYLLQGYALGLVNLEHGGASPLPLLLGALIGCAVGIYALSVAVYLVWNAAVRRLFKDGTEKLIISAGDGALR